MIVSLPALAIGGLFFSAQPSHEYSFLQEIKKDLIKPYSPMFLLKMYGSLDF
jgi:hypothetical protein